MNDDIAAIQENPACILVTFQRLRRSCTAREALNQRINNSAGMSVGLAVTENKEITQGSQAAYVEDNNILRPFIFSDSGCRNGGLFRRDLPHLLSGCGICGEPLGDTRRLVKVRADYHTDVGTPGEVIDRIESFEGTAPDGGCGQLRALLLARLILDAGLVVIKRVCIAGMRNFKSVRLQEFARSISYAVRRALPIR